MGRGLLVVKPMTFIVKDWKDANEDGTGDHSTPTDAAAIKDLERRVTDYSDSISGGDYLLDANTAAGASQIVLNRAQAELPAGLGLVAINPFTTSCEIRKVWSVSGSTVVITGFSPSGSTALRPLELAHTAGELVLFFDEDSVPASWFGALGNNSSDDEPAIQWGLRQTAALQLWLDGANKDYRIGMPVVSPNFARWRSWRIHARTGYFPNDANNAMLMCSNGPVLAFTSDAATDVFTTASAHGIGLNTLRDRVVFKGSGLPTGVVAGRLYWVVSATTTTTFKIANTQNGAPLDVGAGSGTAYTNVGGLGRTVINEMFLDGANESGVLLALNGAMLSQQQPARCDHLRIDNCSGYGLDLFGQQCVFYNFESIKCGTAIQLSSGSFMWFFGTNLEQCNRGIHAVPTQPAWRPSESLPTLSTCAFFGIHAEMTSGLSLSTSTPVEIECDYKNLTFDNVWISNINGQKLFWFHAPSPGSYMIRDFGCVTGNGTLGQATVVDDNRGGTIVDMFDTQRHLSELRTVGSSQSGVPIDPQIHWVGVDGRRVKALPVQATAPTYDLRPGAAQTGEQHLWRDKSGNKASAVNKDGYLYTETNAAPATGDIAAGQVFWWLDDTAANPLVSFKGKDSAGTVFTHSVPAGAGLSSLLFDAKGDMLAASAADTPVRVPASVTNGQVLTSDSGVAAGVKWSTAPSGLLVEALTLPSISAGRWAVAAMGVQGGQGLFSSNRIYYIPVLWINRDRTFDRIGLNVSAAGSAGSVYRLGIYRDDGNLRPGTLVADYGTVVTTTSGFKEITIAESLTPGTYWVAAVPQVATTVPTVDRINAVSWGLAASTPTNMFGLPYQDSVSGALPGTASGVAFDAAVSAYPAVALRAA